MNVPGLAGFLSGFDESLQFAAYPHDPTTLPDGAQLCKIAGQVCYMSFGPKRTFNAQATRYFDNLKSSGHGSVFQTCQLTMLFYGISRNVTHELMGTAQVSDIRSSASVSSPGACCVSSNARNTRAMNFSTSNSSSASNAPPPNMLR